MHFKGQRGIDDFHTEQVQNLQYLERAEELLYGLRNLERQTRPTWGDALEFDQEKNVDALMFAMSAIATGIIPKASWARHSIQAYLGGLSGWAHCFLQRKALAAQTGKPYGADVDFTAATQVYELVEKVRLLLEAEIPPTTAQT
jgi:hypothetical protein